MLFAIDEDNKWECLQVGQSKNNVKLEIKALLLMLDNIDEMIAKSDNCLL